MKTCIIILTHYRQHCVKFVDNYEPLIESVMKKSLTYNVLFTCIISCYCSSVTAQYSPNSDASYSHQVDNRMENYRILKNQGYKDKEIFEDLGNANFLNENYVAAQFWYEKLKEISKSKTLSTSYQKRYIYALEKINRSAITNSSDEKDWLALIESDYKIKKEPSENLLDKPLAERYRELDFSQKDGKFIVDDQTFAENSLKPLMDDDLEDQSAYKTPVAITPDGRTAYYSKAVYEKPLYGVFSKKELVHKIFKAEKVDGKWDNIEEIAVSKKRSSAKHPAISADGKRLFFASNMPGTFGEYDIYVSNIREDGTLGVAKNLGQKVNTEKNDLYPNVIGTNTLFFASEGRKGHGGLDVYMTQVGQKSVDLAVNLGSSINSGEDDFAIIFTKENGQGYVMSNRGDANNTVQRVAFSYPDKRDRPEDKSEYNLLEAFNPESKIHYTTSIFEDE